MSHTNEYAQRGGARLNALAALVVLAALVFTAIKVVPIYVSNYDMQDAMQQEARFGFYPMSGRMKSLDDIRGDMLKKARDLGLPLRPDDLQVSEDGNKISISADYTVQVDLIVYQFSLHFHPQSDNTSI